MSCRFIKNLVFSGGCFLCRTLYMCTYVLVDGILIIVGTFTEPTNIRYGLAYRDVGISVKGHWRLSATLSIDKRHETSYYVFVGLQFSRYYHLFQSYVTAS